MPTVDLLTPLTKHTELGVTAHASFSLVGQVDKPCHIFQVTPGVQATQALHKASELMASVREMMIDAAVGMPFSEEKAGLTLHAVESCKAIIDALIHNLQFPRDASQTQL
ncbi:DUF3077 domain-containing protein [Pseudomonas sp. DC3000-4b1]|uniref:DUF3077 domain-containing protein n=1 Tax=unclassified Pseudomonas TaxID=196821 RepID=UPI003CF88D87